MRIMPLLFTCFFFAVFGCASLPSHQIQGSATSEVMPGQMVVTARKYDFGQRESQYYWILHPGANSVGSRYLRTTGTDVETSDSLDLPDDAHAKLTEVLIATNFFRMKLGGGAPDAAANPDTLLSSIEVKYRGQEHEVRQCTNSISSKDYDKIWRVLEDVARRSVVRTATSPRLNRTADQMGGVISGLTDAGTLTPERNAPIRNK